MTGGTGPKEYDGGDKPGEESTERETKYLQKGRNREP